MSLYQLYFSPTGGTEIISSIICDTICKNKTKIDLSDYKLNFSKYSFNKDDICVVAVPSFGGRVPDIVCKRLNMISGNNARAVMVCVYGNREYEDTLIELSDTLKSNGFRCTSAVAAIAEHSIMHQFAAGRPDENDKKQLKSFAERIKLQLSYDCEVSVPGNRPYKEYNGVPLKPNTIHNECNKCGLCAQKCPVQAISHTNPKVLDKEKCISCMRCISVCPRHAKKLNKMMVFAASQKMKKVCSVRKENKLFI